MLFPIAGSVVFLTIATAASAKEAPVDTAPVNMAGYRTVTLAEAGLSPMPAHPPSGTATSPECARVVRRSGQTNAVDQSAPPPHCQAAKSQKAPAPRQR